MPEVIANAHFAELCKRYPKKRAFITGTGSGIGLAFALQLATDGWQLGITDIAPERLELSANAIQSAGGTVAPYRFDVADYESFHQAVADFDRRYGGIDIGINNAGVACGGMFDELSIETFRRVIDINLMGVVNGCHQFVPIMKRQRSGHVLNVASAAAFISAPLMSAYNSSKAAVLALSETLRAELLEDGVFVSVLMPTFVRTDIGNTALGSQPHVLLTRLLVEQSSLTADQVASETLLKMGAGDLYVVTPEKAQFLWRFKRLLPGRFWRFINGETKRQIAKVTANAGLPNHSDS